LSLCFNWDHAMEAYWGSGGIASRIPDLGTRLRWVVIFTSQFSQWWHEVSKACFYKLTATSDCHYRITSNNDHDTTKQDS
jgi:hypothetical protein